MNKSILILTFLVVLYSLLPSSPTATEIIKKADERMQGKSSKGSMTMKIIRPGWERVIKMKTWSLGQDYSLVLITAPPRDKGAAFLKRENEIWNWQPRIDRVIKLPPSMMMQSWMGSDFTNDDLVKQSSIVTDYEHRLIKDSTINGIKSYKIELIPNEDAAVVWGKIEIFISKENYNQLLTRFYDEDQHLINTMIFSDVKMMGARKIPTKLEVIPTEEPENRTIIEYQDMSFDIELKDSFFSIQNLKRIK